MEVLTILQVVFNIRSLASTSVNEEGNEWYEGYWENDLMHGKGTYKYTSGAVYSGTWVASKQEGHVNLLSSLASNSLVDHVGSL